MNYVELAEIGEGMCRSCRQHTQVNDLLVYTIFVACFECQVSCMRLSGCLVTVLPQLLVTKTNKLH